MTTIVVKVINYIIYASTSFFTDFLYIQLDLEHWMLSTQGEISFYDARNSSTELQTVTTTS